MTDDTAPKRAFDPAERFGPNRAKAWDSEKAREMALRSAEAVARRKKEAEAFRQEFTSFRKQDLPYLMRPVSEAEWSNYYLEKAFDEPWRQMYVHTWRDLRKLYSPNRRETPQYMMLTQRAAALSTFVRWSEAERKDPIERAGIEARLHAYIAQLQKYTEAEKRIDVIVDVAQHRILESIIAIAEFEIDDPTTRHRFFTAMQRAIDEGNVGDPLATRKQLPKGRDPDSETSVEAEFSDVA